MRPSSKKCFYVVGSPDPEKQNCLVVFKSIVATSFTCAAEGLS